MKVNLTVEGTIGTAGLAAEMFGDDLEIRVDFGRWDTPVWIYNVEEKDAIAFKELLNAEGFKVRIDPA